MLKRIRPELDDGCISDLRFEAWRTGELQAEARSELTEHLAGCARCRERKLLLERQLRQIEAALPAFRPRRVGPLRRHGPWVGVLAAACALLLSWPRGQNEAIRSKGSPALGYFIKRGERVFEANADQVVMPGDVLRFVVTPQHMRYVAILSRSQAGETSVYYPQGDSAAALAGALGKVALEGAVQLDETLQDEQVSALFCEAPFSVGPLRSELAARGTLRPRTGCSLATLTLHKQAGP